MKKILFLISICFLLTGCTINYNLEISNEEFKETITGNVPNNMLKTGDDTDFNIYYHLLNSNQPTFKNNNKIFYEKTINKTEEKTDFEYTYTFNENNFVNSRILNECFDNFSFKNEENKYYIDITGKFKCAYSEKINIKLKTDYQVIGNNIKKKNKNTYTLTINKNDIEDIDISLTIDKNEKDYSNILNWSIFKTIGLIVLLILSGIAIFIGTKKLKD